MNFPPFYFIPVIFLPATSFFSFYVSADFYTIHFFAANISFFHLKKLFYLKSSLA